MPTIAPIVTNIPPANRMSHVSWANLASGDDGFPVGPYPGADRSVQVTGTFGGSTVTLQGSNDLTSPTNWFTLSDPQGNPLTWTSSRLEQISEYPLWMRPVVVGGTGTGLRVEMLVARGG